MCGQVLMDI